MVYYIHSGDTVLVVYQVKVRYQQTVHNTSTVFNICDVVQICVTNLIWSVSVEFILR
jgi:hypothetical protein